jgi:hypothetical protein
MLTKIAVHTRAQFLSLQSPSARSNSTTDISISRDLNKLVASLRNDRIANEGKTMALAKKKTAMTVTPVGRFMSSLHLRQQ